MAAVAVAAVIELGLSRVPAPADRAYVEKVKRELAAADRAARELARVTVSEAGPSVPPARPASPTVKRVPLWRQRRLERLGLPLS